MAALLPRVFSPVGHLTPLATVSFRVNGSMEPCQYRSPALRLLFVGGGWQASLPRGSSDDRLLLHMYPIRGCKDSRSFRPHKVVWLVPLQHLRQLRTLRTARIMVNSSSQSMSLAPPRSFSIEGASGCWTSLIEGLKRLGGDNRRIGCPLLKLAPDRSMKKQSYVPLLAFPTGRNAAPSDAKGRAV